MINELSKSTLVHVNGTNRNELHSNTILLPYELSIFGKIVRQHNTELFKQFSIPTTDAICRDIDEQESVVKRFVKDVVETSLSIQKHFKSNLLIILTNKER